MFLLAERPRVCVKRKHNNLTQFDVSWLNWLVTYVGYPVRFLCALAILGVNFCFIYHIGPSYRQASG